jgi:Zn-finger nucleic acid-binding protein
MAPICPKCRKPTLEGAPGALADPGRPGGSRQCSLCRGLWLPRSLIEYWQHDPFVEGASGESTAPPPVEDHRTGLCPDGHGIMIRARVDGPVPFHIERCPHCRGVWLDRGEWKKLASQRFLDHLDDLWDPRWQRRRRAEAGQRSLDQALAQQLGSELYADLERLVRALGPHPARAQVMAWLRERLDG